MRPKKAKPVKTVWEAAAEQLGNYLTADAGSPAMPLESVLSEASRSAVLAAYVHPSICTLGRLATVDELLAVMPTEDADRLSQEIELWQQGLPIPECPAPELLDPAIYQRLNELVAKLP